MAAESLYPAKTLSTISRSKREKLLLLIAPILVVLNLTYGVHKHLLYILADDITGDLLVNPTTLTSNEHKNESNNNIIVINNTYTTNTNATTAVAAATATTTITAPAAATARTTNTPLSLRPHPHMGARFPNGSFGYIADPTLIRRNFLERYSNQSSNLLQYLPLHTEEEHQNVCGLPPGKGHEQKAYRLLTEKIQVNGSLPVNYVTNTTDEELGPLPKVFCGIYTYDKKHPLLQSQAETWGWRCDGFLGFSTQTVPEVGAVDLPHRGSESYQNMWQKVRSIWAYIHDHYIDEFDYFHLSGDDNHFIIENMKNYLSTLHKKQDKPLYIGHHFKSRGVLVCGGGAGYTLNRVALRLFVKKVLPKFRPTKKTSSEDAMVGIGLRKITRCRDTADANGEQRYTGMDPNMLATFNGGKGIYGVLYRLWAEKHGRRTKFDLVSSQHIAFHTLRKPIYQKRIHAILYRSCPRGTVLGDIQWNDTTATGRHL